MASNCGISKFPTNIPASDAESRSFNDLVNTIKTFGHSEIPTAGSSSVLDSVVLIDVESASLDDEENWLNINSKKFNGSIDHTHDGQASDLEHEFKNGKTYKVSNDLGQVTQIIGVLPLSTSSKDLSTIGIQEVVELVSPNRDPEFSRLNSLNSASNNNLFSCSGCSHNNVDDVQNTARLQEQSLRMSFSTPLVNSLKVLSSGLNGFNCFVSNKEDFRASIKGSMKDHTKPSQNKIPNGQCSLALKQNDNAQKLDNRRNNKIPTATSLRSSASKSTHHSVPNVSSSYNHLELVRKPKGQLSADSCQKSLPNLSNQTRLSLKPQNNGPKSHGKTLSLLPHSAPPVRTVSQPLISQKVANPPISLRTQRLTSSKLNLQNFSTNSTLNKSHNDKNVSKSKHLSVPKENSTTVIHKPHETTKVSAGQPSPLRSGSIGKYLPSTSRVTNNNLRSGGSFGLTVVKPTIKQASSNTPLSKNVTSSTHKNIYAGSRVHLKLPDATFSSSATKTLSNSNDKSSFDHTKKILTPRPIKSTTPLRSMIPNTAFRRNLPLAISNKSVPTLKAATPERSVKPLDDDEQWKEGCF